MDQKRILKVDTIFPDAQIFVGAALRKCPVWTLQFPLRLCLQPLAPQPLQRKLSLATEGQRAKSFFRFRVAHRDEFRRVCLSGMRLSWSPCYRQPGQSWLSKYPADDLWNKHRGQNLVLRDLCDVKAWLQISVEFSCEWLERSALYATAPSPNLPYRSRCKTTSEVQNNHNVLIASKFFPKQNYGFSLLNLALEALQNHPLLPVGKEPRPPFGVIAEPCLSPYSHSRAPRKKSWPDSDFPRKITSSFFPLRFKNLSAHQVRSEFGSLSFANF